MKKATLLLALALMATLFAGCRSTMGVDVDVSPTPAVGSTARPSATPSASPSHAPLPEVSALPGDGTANGNGNPNGVAGAGNGNGAGTGTANGTGTGNGSGSRR